MNKFQNIANFRLIGRKIREKRLMRRNVSLREKIREKCLLGRDVLGRNVLGRKDFWGEMSEYHEILFSQLEIS